MQCNELRRITPADAFTPPRYATVHVRYDSLHIPGECIRRDRNRLRCTTLHSVTCITSSSVCAQ